MFLAFGYQELLHCLGDQAVQCNICVGIEVSWWLLVWVWAVLLKIEGNRPSCFGVFVNSRLLLCSMMKDGNPLSMDNKKYLAHLKL